MTTDKTSWTPGPWEWDAGDDGAEQCHRYCDVFVENGDLIIANVNDRFSRAVGHANARLIATAPELYEALAHLIEFADHTGQGCSKQVECARSTLLKARGDS